MQETFETGCLPYRSVPLGCPFLLFVVITQHVLQVLVATLQCGRPVRKTALLQCNTKSVPKVADVAQRQFTQVWLRVQCPSLCFNMCDKDPDLGVRMSFRNPHANKTSAFVPKLTCIGNFRIEGFCNWRSVNCGGCRILMKKT